MHNRYFVYTADEGFLTFSTEAERDTYANAAMNDARDNAISEGEWSDDALQICCGIVTHRATKLDVVERPPDTALDAEGCDDLGLCWDDGIIEQCDIVLSPISEGEVINK